MEIGKAAIGRGPRNVGPSFRVDRMKGNFRVISTPHPLHWAFVIGPTMLNQVWTVTIETAQVRPANFPVGELTTALRHAGAIVGALYRVDMRAKFTGPQRYAMGRNLCPRRVPCPYGTSCVRGDLGPDHYHLCQGAPDSGLTVWCADHTHRPDMPGDAFRSLDDSGGD